jgi:hypothetical protein
MRKSVCLVALVLAVVTACVPPPPPTPYARGDAPLIATWDGQPFCVFTGHVEIALTSDTTLITRSWATVEELTPGVAPCTYSLFAVSAWLTCQPSDCGNMQLPMPHLEQAAVEQFTTRSMDFRRLQFHLFGRYQGRQTRPTTPLPRH